MEGFNYNKFQVGSERLREEMAPSDPTLEELETGEGKQAWKGTMPTISMLISDRPVHGLGYQRLNQQQIKDLEALASRAGMSLSDPAMFHVKPETIRDILSYFETRGGRDSDVYASGIVAGFVEAREKYGERAV